jgi:hypothetical protein
MSEPTAWVIVTFFICATIITVVELLIKRSRES